MQQTKEICNIGWRAQGCPSGDGGGGLQLQLVLKEDQRWEDGFRWWQEGCEGQSHANTLKGASEAEQSGATDKRPWALLCFLTCVLRTLTIPYLRSLIWTLVHRALLPVTGQLQGHLVLSSPSGKNSGKCPSWEHVKSPLLSSPPWILFPHFLIWEATCCCNYENGFGVFVVLSVMGNFLPVMLGR